jgi:thiol-disulfide isomerase/thioredoxin
MKMIHMSSRSMLIAVIIFGILCGVAVIYVMNPLARKRAVEARCVTTPSMLDAMRGKAVGEMAGVVVPALPRPLPDMAFQNADGQTIGLSSFKAKTVVMNLWAAWCVPCREEMPALNALQHSMGNDFFEVVAVSVDMQGVEKPKAFLKEMNIDRLNFYASPDGGLFQEMQKIGRAAGLPTSLIIDSSGCEIGYLPGPANWGHRDARALLAVATGF